MDLDERAVPPAGRIGETEDLIASVFVQDGKVSQTCCIIATQSDLYLADRTIDV